MNARNPASASFGAKHNQRMGRLRFIERCIDQYADLAWRTAYVSLRNASNADDLLQQAFLVAWRKADSAPQERAWPWLAKIIIDEAQRFRKPAESDADTLPDPASIDRAKLEQAELAALVQLALSGLSFENRIAIVLTHLAGLSNAEAAELLGISEFNLRARVREGLGQMLQFLGGRVANLSQTLRELPIAAPSGGLAAAKAAWIGTLTAHVAAPAIGVSAKIAFACVMGIAAAALVSVIALVQPTEAPPTSEPVAGTKGVPVPRAQRISPRPEPSQSAPAPMQGSPTNEVPEKPESTPRTVPDDPSPAEPPPRPQPERMPAPASDWRLPHVEPVEPRTGGPNESYAPVAGISGNISSVGSDTLNNLMTLWAEGFRKHYPNVGFAVEGKGSTTGPPALMDGSADLAPMSREMKQEEIEKFAKRYGYEPNCVVVAIDALAVYVHKDNPIEKLSLPQVDAIFSSTRKGGSESDITTWGRLGLAGEWENAPITIFGRTSASGTYGFFKQQALFKGDFKKTIKERSGSAAVVQSISVDKHAIGYSGIGYKTAGVKAVPLSLDGETAYEATEENCYNGKYPLSRYLYIYFNRPPGKDPTPAVQQFLRFIHSKQGQEVVVKDGFVPLNQKLVDDCKGAYE